MTTIKLSPSMQKPATRVVFAALEAAGGPACVRFVGGCVRNALLGRDESDLDLSTQLTPDQVEAALDAAGIKNVPTGKAFGTITAVVDGEPYEITSLREDVETDGRRAVVSFTTDWAKDAVRRDFYINALYADLSGQVYDPTGHGLDDAMSHRVRFIGDAEQRIREDYLRILRFFRFSAGYASTIDEASLAACEALQAGIDALSGERIWQELMKFLVLPGALPTAPLMIRAGIMERALGGFSPEADNEVYPRIFRYTDDPVLRFAALIYPGGLEADRLLALRARLRFSNHVAARLHGLAEGLKVDDPISPQAIYALGKTACEDALILGAAKAGIPVNELVALRQRLALQPVPVFKPKGADLIKRGMEPGPEVGQRLKAIEAEWIAHDFSQSVINQALDALEKRNKK